MKRTVMLGGLVAAGAVGAGMWLKRQGVLPRLLPVDAEEAPVPLVVPGYFAVERVFGGGDLGTPLPLVLVLHGVGADETQLAPHIRSDRPMRVVLLRGGVPSGNGFQWFGARFRSSAADFLAGVSRAAGEIVAALDHIAAQRRITERIVVGYSQGAHLAWWLATTGRFDRVVALSGALPASLRPPRAPRAVRIEAVHGVRDAVIPYSAGQTTTRNFQAAGYAARLTTLRLAGHGLSAMGDALAPALARVWTDGAASVAAGPAAVRTR